VWTKWIEHARDAVDREGRSGHRQALGRAVSRNLRSVPGCAVEELEWLHGAARRNRAHSAGDVQLGISESPAAAGGFSGDARAQASRNDAARGDGHGERRTGDFEVRKLAADGGVVDLEFHPDATRRDQRSIGTAQGVFAGAAIAGAGPVDGSGAARRAAEAAGV